MLVRFIVEDTRFQNVRLKYTEIDEPKNAFERQKEEKTKINWEDYWEWRRTVI